MLQCHKHGYSSHTAWRHLCLCKAPCMWVSSIWQLSGLACKGALRLGSHIRAQHQCPIPCAGPHSKLGSSQAAWLHCTKHWAVSTGQQWSSGRMRERSMQRQLLALPDVHSMQAAWLSPHQAVALDSCWSARSIKRQELAVCWCTGTAVWSHEQDWHDSLSALPCTCQAATWLHSAMRASVFGHFRSALMHACYSRSLQTDLLLQGNADARLKLNSELLCRLHLPSVGSVNCCLDRLSILPPDGRVYLE